MEPVEWLDRYQRAWEQADAEAAAALFAHDGTYRGFIFDDPYQGPEGVHSYWTGVTAVQSNVSVRLGSPIVQSDRTAVEFWTQMDVDGEPRTLAGCLVLRFAPDGRCRELREYWHFADRRVDPPTGWGQ